uniref:Uncharacterized protein n=1 Tax=Amphimedon queenslandica TaxID=400682 RepID=A0A1X7TF56_AMPQE
MVFANSQIEKRLDVLEDKVKGFSLESSPSSSSSERKKIRQKVAAIHDKLDEGFKTEESIKSEHNIQIRDCLVRAVSLAHSEKYKEADHS